MEFNEEYKLLGLNIKRLREEKGLSQEKLAEKAGISLDYLGKIEVSINKPGLKTVFKVAKALNISPSKILEIEHLNDN